LPRTAIREIDRQKKIFYVEKKKLINKGKETGKRTHSNANTRINARDSSFREERKMNKGNDDSSKKEILI
jgi:hypothetical protein